MAFKKLFFLVITLQIIPLHLSFSQEDKISEEPNVDMKKILNKKKITIVITDSGLGGMSVCAGVENKLKAIKSFEEVNLIYFNSHAEKGKGYNSMPNIEMKAEVFDEALISMEKNYSPDIILTACNTLSVVYPYTKFAKTSQTPVLGIVDFGVAMLLDELKKNETAQVLILGTPTTINSDSHRQKLIKNGVVDKKIITQACPNLESEIQDNPKSDAVRKLIKQYLSEAIQKSDNSSNPILAALCCTHYGFSKEIFESEFQEITFRKALMLNPNELMINSIVLEENINKYTYTKINVSVVSRVTFSESEIESIGGLINAIAPLLSEALKNYEHNPNLFDFKY